MKYIIVLTDGAADRPMDALGGKTPYEAADTPNMDLFAREGRLYTVKTVPDGFKPGSDVANLSVMGYAPEKYYTGRSPLEAESIGVSLSDEDMCFRANLVTLTDEENYSDRTMADYSAGEISTEEATELIEFLESKLGDGEVSFFPGVSYRHIMRRHTKKREFNLTPPHDISDRPIRDYLPDDGLTLKLMEESARLLKDHPVNLKRIKEGKNPANSLWIWGEGTKTVLPPFSKVYKKSAGVISAVDLIRGIAAAADMKSFIVPGSTGTVDTNYSGKAKAAIDALNSGLDLIYIHLEGPDECGHQGDLMGKIRAIHLIDEKIIAPVKEALDKSGEDYKFMVLPDHPTPISIKTHSKESVPCVIWEKGKNYESGACAFSEAEAEKFGEPLGKGSDLMNIFLN